MTIQEIYNLGIEMGKYADPRKKAGIGRWLKLEKKKYAKLSYDEKKLFDRERLTNPYADSRLHFGAPKQKVKTVVAGIEIEEAEIALITALSQEVQSTKFDNRKDNNNFVIGNSLLRNFIHPDLIITHHPVGKALAALDEVMHLQADLMAAHNVPINVAEGVMHERIEQVSRSIAPINHMRSVDAARFANIALMNLHTPTDNLVFEFLQNLLKKSKCETLEEIIECLQKVPEYKIASLNNAGPRIFAGAPQNRAGKIVAFDITGGTEGAKEIYPELAKAGIGTIIAMHMKDENRAEAIKHHLNVVICGHISSDSLGMNLFLDELEKRGVEIIPLGGLIRVRRN